METHEDSGKKGKSSLEEEESSLLERLIVLKKQLDVEDEPNLPDTNKYVVSSKSQYRKVNNHNANKFRSTKLDNRNRMKNQNNLYTKRNYSSSMVSSALTNSLNSVPLKSKTVVSQTNPEMVENNYSIEKYNLEINKIVNDSLVSNGGLLLNAAAGDSKSFLATVDNYLMSVQDYLTSSKYVVNKVDANMLSANQTNIPAKNVHVNRKFQDQLISNRLLDSNARISNALIASKKTIAKNKPIKRLSEKCAESPRLVKIGNTKLIRQSLIKSKTKLNNTTNRISNNIIERKPLSTLQCPTSNTLVTSCNKSKWIKPTNQNPAPSPKSLKPINTNMLKWTKPNLLLVNNMNKNSQHNIEQLSDKLILFGQNKIIRQSLIASIRSKKQNYFHKHFTHRYALLRKLQGKGLVKAKYGTAVNDLVKNVSLLRKTPSKPVEIKKNRNKTHSMYSYVNPKLRLNINSNGCLKKVGSSANINTSCSSNKSKNLKVVNNDKNKTLNLNLSKNQTIDRIKNKKTFTKQLCLVFNRFGVCSKLDQGLCDKRHYKKYITLCNKFLTGECNTENCKLSHIISEEKIPFCKHYLNNICVKLNCPFLHVYRNSKIPICKNFLHGYCTLGKKCSKKHLNLCPLIESKSNCPHGQKCLYPHHQSEEKKAVDDEVYEPRYFERLMPNNEESKENKSYHIVPKRHAPLTDLPSYIPL